jgi:tRNA A-37 threonylcarbamoyl transferase component Bud32
MILVSVLQQKTVTISLNTRYNANQASKLREFLLPHFSLNEHQRLAGTTHRDAFSPYIVLNRAHHQFHDPQNPEKPTYRSPLFFPTANSTTALGKALAGLETQDMKANLDFLLTTEGEAWVKELIHQGKKVVNGMMLATAFAPSSWGFGLFNLGLSVTSYGLSALEISQEDDASKKEQLKSALLMDIVFSTPADIGDVSTVLNKFKKLRELPRPTPPQPPSRDGNRLTSVQPGTPAHRADGNPGQPPVSNDRQLNLQGFDQASKPPSPTITQFEQYAKPDNIIYRRPENKIGEGKLGSVYLIDDHQVIKEYRPKKIPRTPNLDYNGTYQKAKNNADAFNRLYGDNSATVYRYLENGQQKISARMKQLDGESLYSLSLPKNKYSANQVSQLFDDFKTESIDKLIDDTVNELVANKIIYNDFAQGNFIYSIDQKKLQVIDFDEAVIKSGNDIVTEAEKQQMRTSLKELLTNFKADVETNRLKMLQDDRELIAARSQFNHEIDGYKISHDSDKYQHLTTKQKEAYDNFNNGVNRIDQHDRKSLKEIKREVGMLLGPELEKKIKKLSEKELIALFNDPQKYKTTLTWEQKGILSHYIQKLGAKNRVEEVTQRLHDSAYQNIKGKGAKYSLHPQQLVITAAEVEDKGRCLPMVLINEAGYASGQMKQLGNNYQRIIDRIDVSQSKAYMQGIDKLHVQRIDPHIVSILDDANNAETKMPWKNITSMVDEVERCNASKSFLVTSDKHAMSIGVKIDGSKKTYHFQEPNIGWIEFKDAQSMKTYMEQTIGNKAQAENFGAHFNNTDNAEESFYRFAPIDTGKLKDVKVDGMGEWTVGDFSSSKTVAPINTIRIEDNIHQALPVGTAADNLQSLMLTPNQSLLSIKRPDFLKADYTQPTQNLKMRDFVNKLVRLNVKVFIDTDTSAQLSMAQARKLKEALQEKGISYISTQTTLLDCFMDGEYHYSSENVAENRNTLSQFNALIRKIEQESTAHPQANIMVCDNAGDGISGLLKSAIELKKQLEDQPNNFNHEIMDKKPTAKITTVISDNFSAASTQDNATYLIVQQAINTVRDDHPGAIERPSDVRLLNAYAEQLLASKNSELINNKIKDNTNNNDEIAEKINSLPAKGMGSLVEMKDRLTMSLAQYAVKWGGGGQYFTPVPEDIKNYINNGG